MNTTDKSNRHNISDTHSRSLLELSNEEAKEVLLKSENYCTVDMPPYFKFDKLLSDLNQQFEKEEELDYTKARKKEGVNYLLLQNKDTKYSWRPLSLINPVIYVALVHKITEYENWKTIQERFKCFSKNKNIECRSIPVISSGKNKNAAEQISKWWELVEQKSIELALDYEYIFHTDIANCYSSIYTHSIAWALHTKEVAKENRSHDPVGETLIGNIIDGFMQDMNSGQTNGIPQGSMLVDFIAEMVLGYADLELDKRILELDEVNKVGNFKILRFRDDYRIFVNNLQDGEQILKLISEIMLDLGMGLSAPKTFFSDNVITSSIKPDKLAWMKIAPKKYNLENYLLTIRSHAKEYPDSGSLNKELISFFRYLKSASEKENLISEKEKEKVKPISKEIIKPMISISVDIALNNPGTYPVIAVILSHLIEQLSDNDAKEKICKRINKKFQKTPNTGHLQIWLQRATLKHPMGDLSEELCELVHEKICQLINEEHEKIGQLVYDENKKIWNTEWLEPKILQTIINRTSIIDKDGLKESAKNIPIPIEEIELFPFY